MAGTSRPAARQPPHLSVVIPVYGCGDQLDELCTRIGAALAPITEAFEIILVNDHSPDHAWEVIAELARADERIRGVKLARNFGQHYAITAGLDHSAGEWVVVMDCDLQDLPEEIPNLYHKAREGFHVVVARRVERQDDLLKRALSRGFYKVLSYLTGAEQDSTVANFGIYHRKVIEAVCSMRESIRYFVTMVRWVGFESTAINVAHGPAPGGRSGYDLRRRLRLAVDIMLAYSDKPLRLVVALGLIISLVAFGFALLTIWRSFTGDIEVLGYASVMVSIWFLAGIVIVIMGIIGLYVGKTFEGVKKRPIYIVEDTLNLEGR